MLGYLEKASKPLEVESFPRALTKNFTYLIITKHAHWNDDVCDSSRCHDDSTADETIAVTPTNSDATLNRTDSHLTLNDKRVHVYSVYR